MTLMREILSAIHFKKLEINADQLSYIEVLSSRDLLKMKELIGDHELIFIDEAQNIKPKPLHPGWKLTKMPASN